jgi:hypothetical protein
VPSIVDTAAVALLVTLMEGLIAAI